MEHVVRKPLLGRPRKLGDSTTTPSAKANRPYQTKASVAAHAGQQLGVTALEGSTPPRIATFNMLAGHRRRVQITTCAWACTYPSGVGRKFALKKTFFRRSPWAAVWYVANGTGAPNQDRRRHQQNHRIRSTFRWPVCVCRKRQQWTAGLVWSIRCQLGTASAVSRSRRHRH